MATSAKVLSVTISGFIHSCVTNTERCCWVFYPINKCAKICRLRQRKSNCPLWKQFRLAKTSINPVSKRALVLATSCVFYHIKTRELSQEFEGIWNHTFVPSLPPSECHHWEFLPLPHPWDFRWEISINLSFFTSFSSIKSSKVIFLIQATPNTFKTCKSNHNKYKKQKKVSTIQCKPDRVVTLSWREDYLASGHKLSADTKVRLQQLGSDLRI